MADSPQHDRPPVSETAGAKETPPDGGGLDGYRARYDHYRAQGLDHNAAQRAASNKGAAPSGASDAPPKRPGGGRGAGGAKGGRSRTAGVSRTVREMVSTVGGLAALADPYTGAVLVERAGDLGDAVDKAAVHNPRIREAVNGLAAGGIYGGLIFCALSILVPILARWGLIPPPWGPRLVVMMAPESMREEVQRQAAAAPPPPPRQEEPAADPYPRAA